MSAPRILCLVLLSPFAGLPAAAAPAPPVYQDAELSESIAAKLAGLEPPTHRVERLVGRYRLDRNNLQRYYPDEISRASRLRLATFDANWRTATADVDTSSFSPQERSDWKNFRDRLIDSMAEIECQNRLESELSVWVPFAQPIAELVENRVRVKEIDPRGAAETLAELNRQLAEVRERWSQRDRAAFPEGSSVGRNAADWVGRLERGLGEWHAFYDGYDPLFSWWTRAPAGTLLEGLAAYRKELDSPQSDGDGERPRWEPDPRDRLLAMSQVATLANGEDVPPLSEFLSVTTSPLTSWIERYPSGRRARWRRRPGEESPDSEGVDSLTPKDWLALLDQLDFDSLSPADRVDFLLFEQHLNRVSKDGFSPPRRNRELPPAVDASGIRGTPIGREGLMEELEREWIAYPPEALIEIAMREYDWCRSELARAAEEMGLGGDIDAAIEKVKTMHVEPGRQPVMIRDLAWEAIDYLRAHQLVTVPPIAAETWRMEMMSPERQRINPFFTGGSAITVSFPTDTMTHAEKLQSMRGNNIPFSRATVHHELIPGHNLQFYMNPRYSSHRTLFQTPFWLEGWALYWEFVLYDRGFASTPEDRVGFLVWRSHRCARIIFSLSYHLGRMTPLECVDFLVEKVGFERNNATAEVRRSVESAPPLYQAAYMLGGLQFRQLRKELVDSGEMPEREFHDAILRAGNMPVEFVRALLMEQSLPRDHRARWRFYDAVQP